MKIRFFGAGKRSALLRFASVFLLLTLLLWLPSCKKEDEESREALSSLLSENGSVQESAYTTDSYAVYKEAYEKAMTVYTDEKATLGQLNAAKKELEDAKTALIRRADFTALKALLEEKHPEENYTTESYQAYKTAYDKAKAVCDNPSSKQSVVNSAKDELQKACQNLKSKADVTTLAGLVTGLISPEGYTTGSYAKYLEVYEAAKALYNQRETEMSEEEAEKFAQNISLCVGELENAIAALEKRGDLKALRTLYEKMNPLYTTASELTDGRTPSMYYTEESYAAFGLALAESSAILISGDRSDAQIAEQCKKLQEAFDALQPRCDTAELEALILSVTSYYLPDMEIYTKESYLALNNAVNEAKDLVGEGKNPTKESVDGVMRKILEAIAGLQMADPSQGGSSAYRFSSSAVKCGGQQTTVGGYMRSSTGFIQSVRALASDYIKISSTADGIQLQAGSTVEASFGFESIHIGLQKGVTDPGKDKSFLSVAEVTLGMTLADVSAALGGAPTVSGSESGKTVVTYVDGETGYELQIAFDQTTNTAVCIDCYMGE